MCSCHLTEKDAEEIGEASARLVSLIYNWLIGKFSKKQAKKSEKDEDEDFKSKIEGNVEVFEYDPQFNNLRRRRHSD